MRRFKAPSPAMVVALIALFVALGGTGFAARSAFTPTKAHIITIVKRVAPTLSVKSAAGATPLPSGKTESGLFAGGSSHGSTNGWIGLTVVYPRPLAAAIATDHIIDVQGHSATATHCSGPGHADKGYLCLYNEDVGGVSTTEFHSNDGGDFPVSMGRFGANLYWMTNASQAYVGGSWTVTAP